MSFGFVGYRNRCEPNHRGRRRYHQVPFHLDALFFVPALKTNCDINCGATSRGCEPRTLGSALCAPRGVDALVRHMTTDFLHVSRGATASRVVVVLDPFSPDPTRSGL